MFTIILPLVIAEALGLAVVTIVVRPRFSWTHESFLHGLLAFGAGISVSSYLFFGWLLAAGAASRAAMTVEIAVIGCLAIAWCRGCRFRRREHVIDSAETSQHFRSSWSKINAILFSAYVVSLGICLSCYVILSVNRPTGEWDTWAIWNMRARFLALAGDAWPRTFANGSLPHTDYPLLLPLSVARFWIYMGCDSPRAPAALSGLFTVATVMMLTSAVSALQCIRRGLMAGVFLFGGAGFIYWGGQQQADVPLSFFILAAVTSLLLYHRSHKRCYLLLAGLMGGAAAWTKNEGLLFLSGLLVSHVVVFLIGRKDVTLFGDAAWIVAGAAPALLCIAIFKSAYAPASDLFHVSSIREQVLDFRRYGVIGLAFCEEFLRFGGWRNKMGTVTLALCAILLGVRARPGSQLGLRTVSVTLLLVLAGYFFIYVITPQPLKWHLETSCHRLFLHLWPSTVLLVFMVLGMPTEERSDSLGARLS